MSLTKTDMAVLRKVPIEAWAETRAEIMFYIESLEDLALDTADELKEIRQKIKKQKARLKKIETIREKSRNKARG